MAQWESRPYGSLVAGWVNVRQRARLILHVIYSHLGSASFHALLIEFTAFCIATCPESLLRGPVESEGIV